MKIVVLNGSPNIKGSTNILIDAFSKGAKEAGHSVDYFDIPYLKIHPCFGCVKCGYNVPVCMLVCADKDIVWQKGDYSTLEMDATIVATHLILEATNLGVDSVWVRNFEPKQAQKEFNLGENVIPICMIQLGYRAPDCPNNPMHNKRKNIEEVVKFL